MLCLIYYVDHQHVIHIAIKSYISLFSDGIQLSDGLYNSEIHARCCAWKCQQLHYSSSNRSARCKYRVNDVT